MSTPKPEGEVHIVITAAERRHDDGMSIWSEGRLRSLQLEAPAERNTDWKEEQVRTITHIGAESNGERAIEREALAVADDSGAEIATEQEAGIETAGTVRESGMNTEIVGSPPVAVEPLQSKVDCISRIRQRRAELMVGEGAVRRLEDRRAGLLRCYRTRP